MKITREIGGKQYEFELTRDELYRAFDEQEHIYDVNDIEDVVFYMEDAEVLAEYGISKEAFLAMKDEMAYEKRRNMDKYDMSWDYARDEAVSSVLAAHGVEV